MRASLIGDARLHSHAIARLQVAHRGAHFDDDAGGLVPEHHRRVHDERPDPPVLVVVHVAAADPDGIDGDAHVVGRQRLIQVDLAQGELLFPFQHQRLHTPSSVRVQG